MKKHFSIMLCITCLLTSTLFSSAGAADIAEAQPADSPIKMLVGDLVYEPELANDAVIAATTYVEQESPFKVLVGTLAYDAEDAAAATRAVNIPTSYAPINWYGQDVHHNWTADSYTWSSYFFNKDRGYYFDCQAASQYFGVAFYYDNGTYIGSGYGEKQSNGTYLMRAEMDGATGGYYVKIVNKSNTSITSNSKTYYCVYPKGY